MQNKFKVILIMPLCYEKLLSSERLRESTIKGRSIEEEFGSDQGRVVFSAPFRLLQNKAQVFSLEGNASVRRRLTHSIEVSFIGKYIVQQLKKLAKEKNDDVPIDKIPSGIYEINKSGSHDPAEQITDSHSITLGTSIFLHQDNDAEYTLTAKALLTADFDAPPSFSFTPNLPNY